MAAALDTLSAATCVKFVPQILDALPEAWRGTTFNNSNLLGRATFAERLAALLVTKDGEGASAKPLTKAELLAVGNAEDYFRVSSNVSTTLEVCLALQRNVAIEQVFTFASAAMPIVAAALATKVPTHVYTGDAAAPLLPEQLTALAAAGANITVHSGAPPTNAAAGTVALAYVADAFSTPLAAPAGVHGVVAPNLLVVTDAAVVLPKNVLVIRKRMSTPMTTPQSLAALQRIGGVAVDADDAAATSEEEAAFLAHLQTLSGTEVDTESSPCVFTAGLPSIASLWLALIARGGADILMCSTAYGGSNQLTDVVTAATDGKLRKHTFDIQGTRPIGEAIKHSLSEMSADAASLLPTTVLFVEIPTNPDMKVPDLSEVSTLLSDYEKTTGKQVMLLIDATFAPNSQAMTKLKALLPNFTVVVFLSMSKSVSRGMTTAGALIFNHTGQAKTLCKQVATTAATLDVSAKKDQVKFLCDNHVGVEERCQKAYEVTVAVGDKLVAAVAKAIPGDAGAMPLCFVSPEQAAKGFTTSTFSFNLPPPKDATVEVSAALAQKFVDLLCAHPQFKPCVSFGQDNGVVYATVPATSTQGAIKEEDKAKQAVGGVQLTRLSFPPTPETDTVIKIIEDSVAAIYA